MLTVEKIKACKALLEANEVPDSDRIMYYDGVMYRTDGMVKNAGDWMAKWRRPTEDEATIFRLLLQDELA